jgi:hypothetical protein
MAKKIRIFKKDGTATPFFWSDRGQEDHRRETVYKDTSEGVKRMRGVHFDVSSNRLHKE